MTNPLRTALPALLLLLAPSAPGAAWAQTSLGQPGSLPPPRAAAPAAAPTAPATAPAAPTAPKPPARPQAPAPAKAEQATPAKPAQANATKAETARPEKAAPPKPPAPPPTLQQRPGTSNSAKPVPPPPSAKAGRKAAPAAAAGAAAGAVAAGTAATPAPAAPPPPPKPSIGSATGLPLPRFAALGSNQVNLRIGPDLRYKIEWTYQRKDLPVQIVEEHENWRRIRDPEGTEGWVQRPLLTSRRSFLVKGEERALRRRAEDGADAVARLKPGVIGSIRKCEAESPWCEAKVGDYRGWIKRSEIWGVAGDEAIN